MDVPFMFTHIARPENFTIFDVKWIPGTAKFVAIGGKPNAIGSIKVFELNNDRVEVVREINKRAVFKCSSFGLSSSQESFLSVGDFNGSLQIINVERLDGCVYNVPNAHHGTVNAIDTVGNKANHGASEIVTGGQDGCVKVWDPRQNSVPVANIEPLPAEGSGNGRRDCWSVEFSNSYNNEERCVCAGYDNGDLKLFDLRTMQVRWESNIRNGICSIETNNKYAQLDKLIVATTLGGLNMFDFNDESQVPCISKTNADELPCTQRNNFSDGQHNATESAPTIWCVRHLPQNPNIFATCGGSGNLRLWLSKSKSVSKGAPDVNSFKQIHEYSISNQAVNSFDWSPDRIGLAVCSSFDKVIRILISSLPLNL